jgi:hypothetical protein
MFSSFPLLRQVLGVLACPEATQVYQQALASSASAPALLASEPEPSSSMSMSMSMPLPLPLDVSLKRNRNDVNSDDEEIEDKEDDGHDGGDESEVEDPCKDKDEQLEVDVGNNENEVHDRGPDRKRIAQSQDIQQESAVKELTEPIRNHQTTSSLSSSYPQKLVIKPHVYTDALEIQAYQTSMTQSLFNEYCTLYGADFSEYMSSIDSMTDDERAETLVSTYRLWEPHAHLYASYGWWAHDQREQEDSISIINQPTKTYSDSGLVMVGENGMEVDKEVVYNEDELSVEELIIQRWSLMWKKQRNQRTLSIRTCINLSLNCSIYTNRRRRNTEAERRGRHSEKR